MKNKETEIYQKQSDLNFVLEVALRVIRAFAFFYMFVEPFMNCGNLSLSAKTILISFIVVLISNVLLKKIRGF